MIKELSVLDSIPSYALATAQTGESVFEDLLGGISAGAPPAIKVKNGKFRTVVGGEETVVPASTLIDNMYLPVVILGAKRALNKTYYAEAYSPEDEPAAPDCWSVDSVSPAEEVKSPVAISCAGCPMNAFGSGRNAKGEPTKGKRCTDTKILAVGYKGGVYQLRIPPASLKGFGAYAKQLSQHNTMPGNVVTYIGIDDEADFPMMTFRAGDWVSQDALPRLAAVAAGTEVYDIVHPTYAAVADSTPATTDDSEEEKEKEKKKKAAAERKKKAAEKKAAEKAAAEKKAAEEDEGEDEGADEGSGTTLPSDDELDSILGF